MGRKRFPSQSVAMVEFCSRSQHLMANHLPKTFEPNNTNDKLEKRMIVYKRKNKSVVEASMPIVSSNLAAEPQFPVTYSNPELSRQPKRAKICNGERSHSSVVDYSDPFALPQMLEALDEGKHGQVTKEIESLCARRRHILNDYYRTYPSLSSLRNNSNFQHSKSVSMLSPDIIDLEREDFANNAVSAAETCKEGTNNPLVINLDSDEDGNEDRVGTRLALIPTIEPGYLKALPRFQIENNDNSKLWSPADGRNISVESNWKSSYMYEKVVLGNYKVKKSHKKLQGKVRKDRKGEKQEDKTVDCNDEKQDDKTLGSKDEKQDDKTLDSKDVKQQDKSLDGKNEKQEDRKTLDDGVPEKEDKDKELSSYIGLPDSVGMTDTRGQVNTEDDGLTDIWREMTLALECSKEVASDGSAVQQKGEDECEHSCILKDDLGYVCQICGVIQKRIETIFDYQWIKGTRSTKTYPYESRNKKVSDRPEINQFSGHEQDSVDEIAIHPRHMKQMKPHQVEGIKFLLRNLVAEKPGGCILAHAPGSGKTFMIISFIQSFLAKYPYAKPLVILPKGILATWKKEFQRWQVEDIPLYDFYSSKADSRPQQLEVLNNWVKQKSVLFLGYKQFSTIIHGIDIKNPIENACRESLLETPSLLILDEGHTPRNENTDILHALAMVKTPRKVVLSGTLFQNHVREVFNILNLVRPKFLKLDTSRAIVKRVLSRVQISGGSRRNLDLDSSFFDLVEETLQRDDDFKRKITVIKDLREMTNNVLHYYKGDFLEELPGFVDFAVVLNLTEEQKSIIQKLPKMDKFKRSSVGSAIYMHPQLLEISQKATGEKGSSFIDDKIDQMVENLNVNDGVKTKFFLNILGLAESAGEKILVFSQYLLPLKFLERILVKVRGWRLGKEIFMISGDSSPEHREWSMEQFNNSQDGKVLFGSIKACGEGISLVGASRVLILDVHLNPSVTRQAIGRAYRPGQMKKVHTYRLVAADSPEEEDHSTSFRKELISKMWFEWSEFGGAQDFNMEEVDVKSCEDLFLESSFVNDDVKVLFKR